MLLEDFLDFAFVASNVSASFQAYLRYRRVIVYCQNKRDFKRAIRFLLHPYNVDVRAYLDGRNRFPNVPEAFCRNIRYDYINSDHLNHQRYVRIKNLKLLIFQPACTV